MKAFRWLGLLLRSTAFRIALVWALVFGTWNRSGYSLLHFGQNLWQDFATSPGLVNFNPTEVNTVAAGLGLAAVGVAFTLGNIFCNLAGRRRAHHYLLNLLIGLATGAVVFLVLSGANGTEYRFAPLLWLITLTGVTLFLWWLFYRWATELMGRGLFWFATAVIGIGMVASVYSLQWQVDTITAGQVVVALALSIGSVIYPMMRRRATGQGSVFTSYHGADAEMGEADTHG